MRFVTAEEIERNLDFKVLVPALQKAFADDTITTPDRLHLSVPNPEEKIDSTLLLMPAWKAGEDLGVKLVMVSPNNGAYGLPSIHGTYILMNARFGTVRLALDAKMLTAIRTAATSALASTYLSRPDSISMLMIGTGALAPHLIKAHASVRNLNQIILWGRNQEKAKQLAHTLQQDGFPIEAITSLEKIVGKADIISCATLSELPLIHGKLLRAGQHVDLVGSYRPSMREADDDVMRRASLYIDHAGALHECGDLAIPLAQGTIKKGDIKGSLFDLCSGRTTGRKSPEDITCFKSVGLALEDLVAARLVADALDG
ncbi:MAG: ornithine cyclodeaminase family protein [Cyclobacteriaceae bacterium]|nr:ornithine cyclodeaminase family protein [Cyclobacteriaceae bacterium]